MIKRIFRHTQLFRSQALTHRCGMFKTLRKQNVEELDPVVSKFIDRFTNSKLSGKKTIQLYNDFFLQHPDGLTHWMLLELTKEKLISLLHERAIDSSTKANAIYLTLCYLLNLKRFSFLWYTESLQTDLFDELDNCLVEISPSIGLGLAGRMLNVMGKMNYQNKRLLAVLVPKILKAKAPDLYDTTNVMNGLYRTKLIADPKLRSYLTKVLEVDSALKSFKGLFFRDYFQTLYILIGSRCYPKNLFMDYLEMLNNTDDSKTHNRVAQLVLSFLFHVDKDLHNLPLEKYAHLKDKHEEIYQEQIHKMKRKFKVSKWEQQVTDILKEELNSRRDIKAECQKIVNYWSIDICLTVPGRKPMAIDVGFHKEFRNDVYAPEFIPKNRWLTYIGYENLYYNEDVHKMVMSKNKGLINGYLEYLDEIKK
eukprot:TRINITY_DN12429_c0_g1_i1.p1 TRINITY_DN12429_c0_g1~~TRINITY_DN12429_c0_g1_i1.p1  ORF type:complete len:422 (-),score=63.18 TRINITY_DN12429_c0_g1_i1:134-1399(-)